MRPYHPYSPDQAFLLPASLTEVISANDPVYVIRRVIAELDLSRIHADYRAESGRPPFHPQAMAGLLLYGACRGIYSSRKLAQACRDNVAFMYLTAWAQPEFHTIAGFRKRFQDELMDLFGQVLELCRKAGLVRLGHVSLDGTKIRANASKHKAMSYERLLSKRQAYEEEIEGWFKRAAAEDAVEDEEHGPDDDGFSLPDGWFETLQRLRKLEEAQARLEEEARQKVVAAGGEPEAAQVNAKAQTNFTDPESRIMHTPDGFQQCYSPGRGRCRKPGDRRLGGVAGAAGRAAAAAHASGDHQAKRPRARGAERRCGLRFRSQLRCPRRSRRLRRHRPAALPPRRTTRRRPGPGALEQPLAASQPDARAPAKPARQAEVQAQKTDRGTGLRSDKGSQGLPAVPQTWRRGGSDRVESGLHRP